MSYYAYKHNLRIYSNDEGELNNFFEENKKIASFLTITNDDGIEKVQLKMGEIWGELEQFNKSFITNDFVFKNPEFIFEKMSENMRLPQSMISEEEVYCLDMSFIGGWHELENISSILNNMALKTRHFTRSEYILEQLECDYNKSYLIADLSGGKVGTSFVFGKDEGETRDRFKNRTLKKSVEVIEGRINFEMQFFVPFDPVKNQWEAMTYKVSFPKEMGVEVGDTIQKEMDVLRLEAKKQTRRIEWNRSSARDLAELFDKYNIKIEKINHHELVSKRWSDKPAYLEQYQPTELNKYMTEHYEIFRHMKDPDFKQKLKAGLERHSLDIVLQPEVKIKTNKL